MDFFDEQWRQQVAAAAPPLGSEDAFDVAIALAKGRGSDQISRWRVEGGQLIASPNESTHDALTITISPDDARAIVDGKLSVPVAYMQGRLKPVGDNELWLRLAKVAKSAPFDDWMKSVASLTF